jgi:hypothetical protein
MQVKRLGSFDHICGLIGGTHMLWRSDDYVTGWKAATWFWQAFPNEFILNYCYRFIEAGKRPEKQVW